MVRKPHIVQRPTAQAGRTKQAWQTASFADLCLGLSTGLSCQCAALCRAHGFVIIITSSSLSVVQLSTGDLTHRSHHVVRIRSIPFDVHIINHAPPSPVAKG